MVRSGSPRTESPWDALRYDGYPLRAVIGRDDAYNHYIDSTQKALYTRVLPLQKDFTVLDFGCGNGRWAFWFAPQVDRVIGVDPSPDMVRAAQRLAPGLGVRNASFTLLTDDTPPFPGGAFDVVNCVWVLKYILSDAEVAAVIEGFARATRPGGYVALIEQVNQSQPLLVEDEGYFEGQARYRMPDFYIDTFRGCGMDLRYHALSNASPLFWACSRLRRAMQRFFGAPRSTRPPRYITAVSIYGDLMTGRVMRFRSGHHFFLFRKSADVSQEFGRVK
ncbi:MAG: class I SAM-dependent methyltransferase [Methanomicrobiales archaeon]|nr:class I SAM-dependent methyltransferase [Methanomicrobiales archaeon]